MLGTRLNKVLARLLLMQESSAIDYSRDRVSHGSGGHGAHGDPSRPPSGNSRPLVDQWAERFERMIEAAEVDAGLRAPREATNNRNIRSELRSRMPEYEGHDPVYVAYHEGCSVEIVREVRRESKRHMVTGHRLERHERPQTAPPVDGLRLLQETIGGEL